MARILITGGSGTIGSQLTAFFIAQGDTVVWLSRNPENAPSTVECYKWDLDTEYLDSSAFKEIDYIINLAGASVFDKRWSSSRKKEIYASRISATNLLSRSIQLSPHKPKTVITISAVGFYGTVTGSEIFDENTPSGTDFLARTARDWEAAGQTIQDQGIRTITLRLGVVFSPKKSPLQKISSPIQYGFGAVLGSGKQHIPWIDSTDLCRLCAFCFSNPELSGTYNAVAPEHITNREITYQIAQALHKRILSPAIPSVILTLLLGTRASLILKGSRVSSDKITSAGFEFHYDTIHKTLTHLLD